MAKDETDDGDDFDVALIARVKASLDDDQAATDLILRALFDPLPEWIPRPSIDRARRIIQEFRHDGFDQEDICLRVAEAERGELMFPGIVRNAAAFAQSVYELAHLRHAIHLGKDNGLLLLAGAQASHGQRMMDGRRPGTTGPIRKAIAKLLKSNGGMKNAEIWRAIRSTPPKGWRVCENVRYGKYIEGPGGRNMAYARFCNVCADERRELKKFTG